MNARVSPKDTAIPQGDDPRHLPGTDIAIEARGLVKRFGKTIALDGVDLIARRGTVLGLLGPNGAGKTTAVRILATLVRPNAGAARVLGYDVQRDAHQVRQLIGLTGQYASVDEMLSGFNNLVMIGRLLGVPRKQAKARAGELLERFGLSEAAAACQDLLRRHAPPLDLAASMVGPARCSSSTSRPPAWTRAAASSCGTWSAG